MAYIPNSGSVVAFQGNPSALQALVGLHSTNASVITVGGAVANQSVSGTIHVDNFSSVVSYQLAGSVLATSATFTPAANQSVSGTVGASVIGHAPVFIVGGSILTSSTPNQSVSGTVVATQIAGSVMAVSGSFTPAANQSVSGTVGASIIGLTPVAISGNVTVVSSISGGIFPISGSVAATVTNFPTTQNVSGSVSAWLQSTNASVITVGSPVANQSVSGAVSISNFPTTQNISGSVSAWLQSTNASVITVGSPVANQSVSGTVGASIIGLTPVSLTGNVTVVSSIAGGIFPISGSVGAVVTNNVSVSGALFISGSVLSQQTGTVITSISGGISSVALVGANTVSVVGAVNVSGSVVAFQGGTQITSISGIPQASIHGAVTFLPASVVSGHGSVNGAASVQILAAPGSGLHNYVTDILLSNTGAATTLVTITDGDASIMGKLIAPATGGAVATAMSSPMRTMATNKVVNISAATATSVLHAWLGGYRAP